MIQFIFPVISILFLCFLWFITGKKHGELKEWQRSQKTIEEILGKWNETIELLKEKTEQVKELTQEVISQENDITNLEQDVVNLNKQLTLCRQSKSRNK